VPPATPRQPDTSRNQASRRELVTVVVADDHPLFRSALVNVVRSDPELRLVGEAADGRGALELIREHKPRIALLDVKMPDLDGLAVLQAVTRDELPTRVMLLTGHAESQVVYRAVSLGVAAFLPKDLDPPSIVDAIRRVARGQAVIAPEVQAGLVAEVRARESQQPRVLSAREQEILILVADGMSAPEIARHLHLSVTTVKTHLQSIYEKFGVSDRAGAVAAALRRGVIE
jgi:two-component system, NarL family, nitrate/nitrite response regulator NarL